MALHAITRSPPRSSLFVGWAGFFFQETIMKTCPAENTVEGSYRRGVDHGIALVRELVGFYDSLFPKDLEELAVISQEMRNSPDQNDFYSQEIVRRYGKIRAAQNNVKK